MTKQTTLSEKPVLVTPKLSMAFEPARWNDPANVAKANCLAYALDRFDLGWPYIRSLRPLSAIEKDLSKAVHYRLNRSKSLDIKFLFAGLLRIREHEYTPDTHHIIAFSKSLRHFFRLDGDRTWSHKPGATEATNKDFKGQILTNLENVECKSPAIDHSPSYLRTKKLMEEIRKDPDIDDDDRRAELRLRRDLLKIFVRAAAPEDNSMSYFALPKNGIAIIPSP